MLIEHFIPVTCVRISTLTVVILLLAENILRAKQIFRRRKLRNAQIIYFLQVK